MKNVIALLLLLSPLTALADNPYPDCVGNPHACGDDVVLIPGPQGPAGPQGPIGPVGPTGPQGPAGVNGADGKDGQDGIDGEDGADGTDGADGAPGADGKDGRDGRDVTAKTAVGVEGVVRLYDGKHVTVEAFDAYDIRGKRNHFAGARVTLKVGRSYEERLIAKQQARLAAMQNAVYMMEADLKKLKRYAHHPYTGQHRVFDTDTHSDNEPTETDRRTFGGTR